MDKLYNANFDGYSYIEGYVNYANANLRKWNALCLADGELLGTDEPTILCLRRLPWEHEISQLTFKGYDSKQKLQLFADGLSWSGTSGISGGTGRNSTLKLRAQQYKINVPADLNIRKVRIAGYSNYTGTDIHIAELNGQTFGETDYVISATADTWSDITVPLNETVSGRQLTITFKGNSPTVRIYLIDDTETSGISETLSAPAPTKSDTRSYDLQGRLVSNPSRGLYIVNGRKVLIK